MEDESPRQPGRVTSYAVALGVFSLAAAGTVIRARRSDAAMDGFRTLDLVLGALATQKFSRMLAKDPVTTPLRAPFTEYEGLAGPAELNEEPRSGHGRHTVGELLSCPFCLAPWVAGSYVTGLTFAPDVARAWAAVFSMVSASDALQHVYARLQTE